MILFLVMLAIVAVLAITGPAVGNVFSNTVYNLLGGTIEPRNTLSPNEFWQQVEAVASYTPENPQLITNTPVASTPTATTDPNLPATVVMPTLTPLPTATQGPSPTPNNVDHTYPFTDPGDNPDWWIPIPADGPPPYVDPLTSAAWNVEYWNLSDSDTTPATYGSSVPATAADYTTTLNDINFDIGNNSPVPQITRNFYARFTTTVDFQDRSYVLRLQKDDGVRVWIDGQLIVDQWSWDPLQDTWFDTPFTMTAGPKEIRVEFFDSNLGALLGMDIIEDPNVPAAPTCNWTLSSERYRSAPTAWSDSPGTNYSPGSLCPLELRGTIDLTTSTQPRLEFWDQYSLGANASAVVSISEAGTDVWTDHVIHNNETNLGWTRETVDLSSYGDPDGAGPQSGKQIVLRFVLDASSATDAQDGWWVDDITVEEDYLKHYTIGFSDDMETNVNWYAGGDWARSTEKAHSPSQAWTDSPGTTYTHGSNSSLELDGIIDIPAGSDPEIAFWHRFSLADGDAIYAEVSTDHKTWTPLTGGPIATSATNLSWAQETIPLESYLGQSVYFRFRLDTLNGSSVADGWWIDDFTIRTKSVSVVKLNWCDTMESGGANWIAGGTWGVVQNVDANVLTGQVVSAHGGSRFWSDSPRQNYLHNTNSSLELLPTLDLTTMTKHPELVFWHQWDLAASDNIYVEVSSDNGQNWSAIWSYQYNTLPVGYGSVPDYGYNHILSWTREVVSLEKYVGSQIKIRFRLESLLDSSVDDGWWLDDICFQERVQEPAYKIKDAGTYTPFSDNLDQGNTNWITGGTWALSGEDVHSGTQAFSDSPGLNVYYGHESNGIVELNRPIDLSNTIKPTLYFWEKFSLENYDFALVEINSSSDGGATWDGWDTVFSHVYEVTSSWDRRQVNLIPYIGKEIRIRFRLYAEVDPMRRDGWWVDDISVVDRDGTEPIFKPPFRETAETDNSYWVKDGTWGKESMLQPMGSGSELGPGAWTGEYYWNSDTTNYDINKAQYMGTRMDPEIQFNWAGSAPQGVGLPSNARDYFMVRWTRDITVSQTTNYQVQVGSDDGIRVMLDGSTIINRWTDRGFPSRPDTADVTLSPGTHTFVVEYYEKTGQAKVSVNFAVPGTVFSDTPNGYYQNQNDMSLTLEGMIDLTNISNPVLSYWESFNMGQYDVIYTEVSTDGGFTWSEVEHKSPADRRVWWRNDINLSAYSGQLINIRFRLDARNWVGTDDGWWIDDIRVLDGATP